ncbi:MAG: hypothetical protein IJ527_08400 [Prevotella sp.]|nr:hypothetical protein [Prevotella sp.]
MKKIILLFAMMLAVGTANADRKYATFVAPTGSGGSYNTETCTYTWTKNSDNLMTVFTFSNGELATYKALKVVRIGGTYSKEWRANVLFSDGKNKSFIWYNYNDKSIDLSSGEKWGDTDLTVDGVNHTLADVTAIRIGGASDPGTGNSYSVVIDWTCVYLENDNDAVVTAGFAKPASNATYTNTVYSATAGNNNLMDCYTGSAGDFSKYGKLQFEIQNVTGMMRIGFHDGSTFTPVSGDGYGGGGVKHIDLSSYSSAAGSATKIQFGSKDNSGSAKILPTNMFLVRSEAYTRSFTKDQKSTVWFPFALTAEEVAAINGKFYELTAATSSTLTFTEVTGATEAYKPYVFVANETGTPFSGFKGKTVVAPKACSYTVGTATFVGSMKDNTVPAGAYGYNSTNGTFSVTTSGSVTIAPFRAYITNEGAGARLDVNFNDSETTTINAISDVQQENGVMYNLQGQRVGADYKGIVIKNGRKFVVK